LRRGDCRHAFVRRVPGVHISYDKTEALARLDAVHRQVRNSLGLDSAPFLTAEQVHGKKVAVIDSPISIDCCFNSCDGLVTNQRGVGLGIYVADCCAVFLLDPIREVIGLVHSGKKGTELGIVSEAIASMEKHFDSKARDLIAQLSPCIRPPHYEVDFAAQIVAQCRDAGVETVHDCNICTACDLQHYYSYRAEKGRTGRMLALLALA
jgi:YfiH family protein